MSKIRNYLVGISGETGGGKTTLLNDLKNVAEGKDYEVYVSGAKISRKVQAELGVQNVTEFVHSSLDNMLDFQLRIALELAATCKHLISTPMHMVTDKTVVMLQERTFIDIAAFTLMWGMKSKEINGDLARMTDAQIEVYGKVMNTCVAGQHLFDGVIYVPRHDGIPDEGDPNRTLDEYRNEWRFLYNRLRGLDFMESTHNTPRHKLIAMSPEMRAIEAKLFLEECLQQWKC